MTDVHPNGVPGFDGTPEELAKALGRMRYDVLWDVLHFLAKDLSRQAAGDEKGGRPRLAKALRRAALDQARASDSVRLASLVCVPHMPPLPKK